MKRYLSLLITVIIYFFIPHVSMGAEQPYEVWLTKKISDSQLEIIMCVKNNTSQEVTLTLKIKAEKTGKAGTSQTTQSKGVFLKSNEKKCLSRLIFNTSAYDVYKIILEAYKDNQLVAKDSIVKERENE